MKKTPNWKSPQTGFGNTPMKDFRDPVTGKRIDDIQSPKPIGGLDKALGTAVPASREPKGGVAQDDGQ